MFTGLSYNRLSGEIPSFLQRVDIELISSGDSIRRDFSHNRFFGSLADVSTPANDVSAPSLDGFLNNAAVALNVNRLSGYVPTNSIIRQLKNIDMLAGNIFKCDSYDDLPQHDPQYHFYSCGSDILDNALILWATVVGAVLVIAAVTALCVGRNLTESHGHNGEVNEVFSARHVYNFVEKCRLWYSTVDFLDHTVNRDIRQFDKTLVFIRTLAMYVTGFSAIAFTMLYCLGKLVGGWYTHSHQYRWLFTAAYLSGSNAAAAIMTLLFFLLLCAVWCVCRFTKLQNLDGQTLQSTSELVEFNSSTSSLQNFSSLIACFFLNSLVVLSAQGSFVYAVTWYDISPAIVVMLQLLLACFSIVWDNIVVLKVIIAGFSKYLTSAGRIQLQNVLIIFNGVVAPLIVVGFTDPTCFSELISSSLEISTTTSYDYCFEVKLDGGCVEYVSRVCM